MTQNRSHAVMAQRIEPPDSLDYFPTPPWATRALCEHVIQISGCSVWEPACGEGHMARPLVEYTDGEVWATDVHRYHFETPHDFLQPYVPKPLPERFDWVITNPPFRLAEQFILRGLEVATHGVCVLVRSVFAESIGRYESLFRDRPPALIAQFTERVPMVKGRVDPKASSATSYAWFCWLKDEPGRPTQFRWIPPCRKRLEREGDYR